MAVVNLEHTPRNHYEVIFSNGFRPMFTLVALQALLALGGWLAFWNGWLAAPETLGTPLLWHGHEMLFGFVGAAIGGFLLAAVANWTGRRPVHGGALVLLVLCWLLARAVAWLGADWPALFNALAASLYWVVLAILFGRELIASGNRRNLKVLVLIGLFTLFSLAFHLQWLAPLDILHLTLVLVLMLLTLIGGRITPAFTRNWLNRQSPTPERLPAAFGPLDTAAAVMTAISGLVWVFWPQSMAAAVLLALAGGLQLVRVLRWCGWQTRSEPLLWVLHLGYGWIGIGQLLLAGGSVGFWLSSAGLHALTIGAMGGMIMAVASRAALGHTGRALESTPILTLAFVSLHLAALTRIVAALWPAVMPPLITLSALLWLLAFALFSWRYLPILLGPSVSFNDRLKAGQG
jgi:uncharacterized protein involved in response to NO